MACQAQPKSFWSQKLKKGSDNLQTKLEKWGRLIIFLNSILVKKVHFETFDYWKKFSKIFQKFLFFILPFLSPKYVLCQKIGHFWVWRYWCYFKAFSSVSFHHFHLIFCGRLQITSTKNNLERFFRNLAFVGQKLFKTKSEIEI